MTEPGNEELLDIEDEEEAVEDPSEEPFKEALIAEVEKFPVLYAKATRNHKDKTSRENGWRAVAAALRLICETELSDEEMIAHCEKKWLSIRNCYNRKEKTKVKKASGAGREKVTVRPYKYAKQLAFLKPHLQNRRTLSNITPVRRRKAVNQLQPGAGRLSDAAEYGDIARLSEERSGDAAADSEAMSPGAASATSSNGTISGKSKGKEAFLEDFLKQQSKETDKFLQILGSDTEKLDEDDHRGRIWTLKIKKFAGKAKRDLVRAIDDMFDNAEFQNGHYDS